MQIFNRTNKVVAVLACGLIGIQSSLTAEHDHEAAAPPAPASRRTHVSAEELAGVIAAQAAANGPAAPAPKLPPLPDGVVELDFRDFYKTPVGPRGLEPTEKLLSLDGKRVRILGYMGRMERENRRQIIFASMPLQPQPHEYGLCDDVPSAHVLVTVPGAASEQVSHTPGLLLLTGTLSVGTFAKDGETSFVRMLLDAPAPVRSGNLPLSPDSTN